MSKRLSNFAKLETHSWFCRLYRRLSAEEKTSCRFFLITTSDMDANEFELAVNRWFVDKPKPKHWTIMLDLVGAAKNEIKE